MNRPPKRKKDEPKDQPKDPDPQTELPEKTDKPAEAPVQGDDRNLVSVDDAFAEASLEDRVWLIWDKHKAKIIGGILGALAVFFIVQIYEVLQEKALRDLQEEYNEALAEDSLQVFGSNHASQPLGALALLRAADKKYDEMDYVNAAALYEQAAEGLAGLPAEGRARLGVGMAEHKAGQKETARSALRDLVQDTKMVNAYRAQAAFTLGQIALNEENFEEARKWLQTASDIPRAIFWARQAEQELLTNPDLAIEQAEDDPASAAVEGQSLLLLPENADDAAPASSDDTGATATSGSIVSPLSVEESPADTAGE